MRVLLAGWYSFERMGATAGDLMVRDVVGRWLGNAGVPFDVAVAEPFTGGVAWHEVDPNSYTHVLFACGPLGNGWPVTDLFERFHHCRLVALDVTMIEPLRDWNPFDLLLERDSDRTARPDLALADDAPCVPICGVVQVHPQKEYPNGLHEAADTAIRELLAGRDIAQVPIDTRLDVNNTRLRSAAHVESLIARMDVVVTTRLHGLVLALKHGVPVLAIDPVPDGAKVLRQTRVLGWPHVFVADDLDPVQLAQALDDCLTDSARKQARDCRQRALAALEDIQRQLLGWLQEERQQEGQA